MTHTYIDNVRSMTRDLPIARLIYRTHARRTLQTDINRTLSVDAEVSDRDLYLVRTADWPYAISS